MTLVVECKADEALAVAVGIQRRNIEHFLGKGRVCNRLSRIHGAVGMMDEDPGAASPLYLNSLTPTADEHDIRLFIDRERKNRIIILSPRLEEWLVQTAKKSNLKMSEYGFSNDNGVGLRGEINDRLDKLTNLVNSLIESSSARLQKLQSILLARARK